MAEFANPFRPGAGHTPPYLAGRQAERAEFQRLLGQTVILENMVLTGLRGVGKTVLLDSFRPLAIERGWIWVRHGPLGVHQCQRRQHGHPAVHGPVAHHVQRGGGNGEGAERVGFEAGTQEVQHTLGYQALMGLYHRIPGLALDKIKGVLEVAWGALSQIPHVRGIIFAYDEAQNLSDQSAKEQYPLSLLLDCFQSLQKKGLPLMLVLTGLPTLFPKLVEARTFSERMFRVLFLQSLDRHASEDAIRRPIADFDCPLQLDDDAVATIVTMSGGYPYFIQFICREVYDAFIQRIDRGERASVPVAEIEQKLDTDFFAGRWARATDRQRALLSAIAQLDNCDEEFTVQEVVEASKRVLDKPFSSSHINQMLVTLASQGLVYKNRHGKYSFAVPLLGRFIRRQAQVA